MGKVNLSKNELLKISNISNPNILINGDFRVNQRGKPSYTGAGYSVDRWRNSNNNTILKKLEGIGIELSSKSGSVYLIQTIEDGFNILKGKTVTASVQINGVVYSATGIVPTEIPTSTKSIAVIPNQQGIISTGLYIRDSGLLMFQIGSNGTTLNIEYAKLELGAVSTTFIPKTYAEELAMCQRYFYSTGETSSKAMLLTARTTYDFYQNYFYFPVQMRTQPTILLYGGENEYANALPLREDNNTCIEVASDAGLGVGNGFMIYAKNNNAVEGSQYKLNKIEADAEIY